MLIAYCLLLAIMFSIYLLGKFYYEVTMNDEGLSRVGWSSLKASRDLGTDRDGFGFGGTGKKSNNRQFDSYGAVCWIAYSAFLH